MSNVLCSCDTKKPFSECCEPALKGEKLPASAADLMRSRYTAFVRHEIDYIMNSVAPARRADMDRKSIEDWSNATSWDGLEILSTEKGGAEDTTGKVEFIARFHDGEEAKEHHELATFVKLKGAWFFDDGHTPAPKPVRLEGPKIGRNDPCHCGSGKKFKKCHGAG